MIHDFSDFVSPLPHPGKTLREDFMAPYKLSAGRLARHMGLKDRTRVERIAREQQPITADTALRLARVFGTTPQFWINLQTGHDLSKAAIAARQELGAIIRLEAVA
ncbi:MAG: HigA family addiction module antitoxin [Caulobacteraceae bacterium]